MRELLFITFLTIGILFFFIAGFSQVYRGFKIALLLGILFLWLAIMVR